MFLLPELLGLLVLEAVMTMAVVLVSVDDEAESAGVELRSRVVGQGRFTLVKRWTYGKNTQKQNSSVEETMMWRVGQQGRLCNWLISCQLCFSTVCQWWDCSYLSDLRVDSQRSLNVSGQLFILRYQGTPYHGLAPWFKIFFLILVGHIKSVTLQKFQNKNLFSVGSYREKRSFLLDLC